MAAVPLPVTLLADLARGDLAALHLLLLSGTIDSLLDARLETEHQDTLLTWAARHAQSAAVRLLLDSGASVCATTGRGATALFIACQNGHYDCVLPLLRASAQANSDQANANGATPLFIACQQGRLDIARLLCTGADVNRARNDGGTPLFAACLAGHMHIARLLVDAGARVNQPNLNGASALLVACGRGHVECSRYLIDAGAAVEQPMANGATPLAISCMKGHLEIVKLLSSHGASRAATPFGSPEEVATRYGYPSIAAWLVASRGWTPLAHLESLTAARATSLLRSGAGLHEGEPTPLQRAAGGEGEAAALVRRAAEPWSPASHSLFPAPARACAVALMWIGHRIAYGSPSRSELGALSDAWREHVVPHAVARERSGPPVA